MNEDLSRRLQEKLGEFEAEPHPESWSAIQDKLGQPRNRPRLVPWLPMAAIWLMAGLIIWFHGYQPPGTRQKQKDHLRQTARSRPPAARALPTLSANSIARLSQPLTPVNQTHNSTVANPHSNRKTFDKAATTGTDQVSKAAEDGTVNLSTTEISNRTEVATERRVVPTIGVDFVKSLRFNLPVVMELPSIPLPETKNATRLSGSSRFEVGLSVSPTSSYYLYAIQPQPQGYVYGLTSVPLLDSRRLGWQVGMQGLVRLTPKIRVRSEAVWGQSTHAFTYQTGTGTYAVQDGAAGAEIVAETVGQQWEQKVTYSALKADLVYFPLANQPFYVAMGPVLRREAGERSLTTYANFSVGLSKPSRGRLRYWLEPSLQYGLNSREIGQPQLQVKAYQVSLRMGATIAIGH